MMALQASLGADTATTAAEAWQPKKGASVVLPRMGGVLATVVTPAPDGVVLFDCNSVCSD